MYSGRLRSRNSKTGPACAARSPLQNVHKLAEISLGTSPGKELTYVPSKIPDESIMEIDGVQVTTLPPVHEITDEKRDSPTPRHEFPPHMSQLLNPPKIDETTATDMVTIHLQHKDPRGGSGCPPSKNHVLFASEASQNPSLRLLHDLHGTIGEVIEECAPHIPDGFYHKDRLAGGCYLATGFGSQAPGPKGCPKSWNGHQTPFLLSTSRNRHVLKIFSAYAEMLQHLAGALASLCPQVLKENQATAEGAEDLSFDTQSKECEANGQNPYPNNSKWFCNQAVLRIVGREIAGLSVQNGKVCLHFDSSDHSTLQPLIYFTFGGKRGLGGPVPNTDLVVFQNQQGGKCYRVSTCIEDCVVIVLFDSAAQLHTMAQDDCNYLAESSASSDPPCWSARFIAYIREPIHKYVQARRSALSDKKTRQRKCPAPYRKVRTPKTHMSLPRASVRDGMTVAVRFDKQKDKKEDGPLYRCTLRRFKNPVTGNICQKVYYENSGWYSKWPMNWNIFHQDCANSPPESCKCNMYMA